MDENIAVGYKGSFPMRGTGSDWIISLLTFVENDVVCGDTDW